MRDPAQLLLYYHTGRAYSACHVIPNRSCNKLVNTSSIRSRRRSYPPDLASGPTCPSPPATKDFGRPLGRPHSARWIVDTPAVTPPFDDVPLNVGACWDEAEAFPSASEP